MEEKITHQPHDNQQQQNLVLGVLVLVVLGTWVYWSEIRPTQVRTHCTQVVNNHAETLAQEYEVYTAEKNKDPKYREGGIDWYGIDKYTLSDKEREQMREDCLQQNGLR